MTTSITRQVARRALALLVDGMVAPAVIYGAVEPSFPVGLAVVGQSALILALLQSIRWKWNGWFVLALVVNFAFFALFYWMPLMPVAMLVGFELILRRGDTPGTFVSGLTVQRVDGTPPSPALLRGRNIAAIFQAIATLGLFLTVVVFAVDALQGAALDWAVFLALIGLGVGLFALVPIGLVDLLCGTRLVRQARGAPAAPVPINPYGSALWQSTVSEDLDLITEETEPVEAEEAEAEPAP